MANAEKTAAVEELTELFLQLICMSCHRIPWSHRAGDYGTAPCSGLERYLRRGEEHADCHCGRTGRSDCP